MKNLLKVGGAIQNNVFSTVLLSLALLWSADNYLSNSDCAALRAMTGPESEGAVILFDIVIQLLKLSGPLLKPNLEYSEKSWQQLSN